MDIVKYYQDEYYKPLAEYYSQEEKSLIERYNLIEKLIGRGTFNYAAGYLCENLLKDYLRSKLPNRYSIDSGFIRCIPDYGICLSAPASPQIDILIHEESCYAPLFRTGDYVVVEPDSVHSIIEVKKTLTHSNLKDALLSVSKARLYALHGRTTCCDELFTGIFAFSLEGMSLTKDSIEQTLRDVLKVEVSNSDKTILNPTLPNSIAILDKLFVRIYYGNGIYTIDCFIKKTGLPDNTFLYSLQGFLFSLLDTTAHVGAKTFAPFYFESLEQTTERFTFTIEFPLDNTFGESSDDESIVDSGESKDN